MTLTKADIVETLQSEIGFTKHQSTELAESLLEHIKSKLESGEDALVSGFGKFCVDEKSERRGRNPATGEDLMLKVAVAQVLDARRGPGRGIHGDD